MPFAAVLITAPTGPFWSSSIPITNGLEFELLALPGPEFEPESDELFDELHAASPAIAISAVAPAKTRGVDLKTIMSPVL
jgi:hypothetical protein